MKRKRSSDGTVGVELKYCEHCGGLWVRERGSGLVYCDKCRGKVEDLPMMKKKAGRATLPGERSSSLAEKYGTELRLPRADRSAQDLDDDELEAMGGVA
jgi:hypothetical protein